MKDVLDNALTNLKALRDNYDAVAQAIEQQSRIEADMVSLKERHAALKEQVSATELELAKAQADARSKLDKEIYQKQGELRSLQERVAETNKALVAASQELNTKNNQVAAINITIADLKQKLG